MAASDEIKLALLIQRVEQLTVEVQEMKKDLDALKGNALRISGGLALMVIAASVIGWLVSIWGALHK